MTSPSVNINSHNNYGDTIVASNYAGTSFTYYGAEVNSASLWKVRPESISTKPPKPYKGKKLITSKVWKAPSYIMGIRQPTPWNHTWSFAESSHRNIELLFKLKPSNPYDNIRFTYPNGTFWYRQTYNSIIPPVPASVVSRSVVSMLEKLQSKQIDIGVFFAEFGEAVETVTSTASRIAKEVTNFRRKDPRGWAQVLLHEDRAKRRGRYRTRVNELPSQWLGMQYGWNPLMQDVQSSASLIDNQLFGGEGAIVRVKGKAATRYSDFVDSAIQGPLSVGLLRVNREWRLSCRTYAYYKLRSAGLATLSQLGLINPALIVWEKIPYSFVVDWFAPIGSWLNAMSAAAGYDFITGCQSTMSVLTGFNTEFVASDYASQWIFSGDPANALSRYKSGQFIRTVLSSSPVPGFYFKNPISTVHMANALALLRNAFKR